MATKDTSTTCPYCGVGCGVTASVTQDGAVSVKGTPDHPANFGRLCSKGSALAETLSIEDRLLKPIVKWKTSDWDTALEVVASRFSKAIAEHGPDSVAFYVSGQLLTEDYYVANKLMKGFIGSANIDTNSRVCMASSVAGHKRAFGSDTVPGCYEDLEESDLVVLVGSNLAWCHPVLYQRLVEARNSRGTKVIVIDPRRTATCDITDLHLSVAPGTDVALFNGLLAHLDTNTCADTDYIEKHTTGCEAALTQARALDLNAIATTTGLSAQDIKTFYELFAKTERVVTVYSQGVNQSTSGTDKVNAIINCHLLTGRIGRPGMGPLSVTGQPNAMGGREVGGLANQLASHMELDNSAHRDIVQTFWRSPQIASRPGLKAVDLFKAVGDGRIKALWIMGTNPAVSLPEADVVKKAIELCPFVVVSDVTRRTDTTVLADVLLPATAWGEKDGTVTNSERRISRQRSFLKPPGKAKSDWWIICQVAKRMGFKDAFNFENPAEIFDEYARLSIAGNDGKRDFDIGALTSLPAQQYDDLTPTTWPINSTNGSKSTERFFADGNFFTPDKRAKFIATEYRRPETQVSPRFPLVLNTGRIRDQWHTMTRTAKSPRLMSHIAEPFIEIHTTQAEQLQLEPNSLAILSSAHGEIIGRVVISDGQQHGSVFAPMHWTDQYSGKARVDALVGANTDPVSGQPESKYTPVRMQTFNAHWHGFSVQANKPKDIKSPYWALAPANDGWRLEFAETNPDIDWPSFAENLFAISKDDDTTTDTPLSQLSYHDEIKGEHRLISFQGNRLVGAVFISRQPIAVSRTWAASLLQQEFDSQTARLHALAGRPGKDQPDPGAIICSCENVGENQIREAVANKRCASVDEIGALLRAGTNCGSCRPEIRKIVDTVQFAKAS